MFNKQKNIGIILSYISISLSIIIALFYKPFLLKTVGESEFGISSLAASLMSFISILDLGFCQTLVRYISRYKVLQEIETQNRIIGLFIKLYTFIAFIGLFLGLLIINIYPLVSKKALTAQEIILFKQIFIILLLNVVLSFPLMVFTSIINAYEQFAFYKTVGLLSLVFKHLTIITFLIIGYRIVAVTIISVVFSLLTYFSYMFYCLKKLKIRISFEKINDSIIKEIFNYSFYIFLNIVIDFLYNNTDKLILGSLIGTAAITVYEFGITFTSLFQELSSSISTFFIPEIVKLYDKDKDIKALSNTFLKIAKIQLFILVLVLSGFYIFGKEFVTLWVGEKYIDSYYVGLIVMIPSIIPLSQNIGISIIRTMNLHKYRSYMYMAIAIFNVIISIPLSIKYGPIGAAIGTSIGIVIGQIIFMNIFYDKVVKIDIKRYWLILLENIIIVIPLIIMTTLFKRIYIIKNWKIFIAYILVYTLIYIIVIYIVYFKKRKHND